ncbi:MAG: hypothetical protein ACPF8V_10600, partial [Luteibaculum sp.]
MNNKYIYPQKVLIAWGESIGGNKKITIKHGDDDFLTYDDPTVIPDGTFYEYNEKNNRKVIDFYESREKY